MEHLKETFARLAREAQAVADKCIGECPLCHGSGQMDSWGQHFKSREWYSVKERCTMCRGRGSVRTLPEAMRKEFERIDELYRSSNGPQNKSDSVKKTHGMSEVR